MGEFASGLLSGCFPPPLLFSGCWSSPFVYLPQLSQFLFCFAAWKNVGFLFPGQTQPFLHGRDRWLLQMQPWAKAQSLPSQLNFMGLSSKQATFISQRFCELSSSIQTLAFQLYPSEDQLCSIYRRNSSCVDPKFLTPKFSRAI